MRLFYTIILLSIFFTGLVNAQEEYRESYLNQKEWNDFKTLKLTEGADLNHFRDILFASCAQNLRNNDKDIKAYLESIPNISSSIIYYAAAAFYDGKCIGQDRSYAKELVKAYIFSARVPIYAFEKIPKESLVLPASVLMHKYLPDMPKTGIMLSVVDQYVMFLRSSEEQVWHYFETDYPVQKTPYFNQSIVQALIGYARLHDSRAVLKRLIQELAKPSILAEYKSGKLNQQYLDGYYSQLYFSIIEELLDKQDLGSFEVLECEIVSRVQGADLPDLKNLVGVDLTVAETQWVYYWTLLKRNNLVYPDKMLGLLKANLLHDIDQKSETEIIQSAYNLLLPFMNKSLLAIPTQCPGH